jgi:hypothetical protein
MEIEIRVALLHVPRYPTDYVMSVTEIIADEQVLRHNAFCFARLVGHSSNKVELLTRYVDRSADSCLPAYSMS